MALTFDHFQTDTVAAIATAMSEAGIGIIRISGPDAAAIGSKLYRRPIFLSGDPERSGSVILWKQTAAERKT